VAGAPSSQHPAHVKTVATATNTQISILRNATPSPSEYVREVVSAKWTRSFGSLVKSMHADDERLTASEPGIVSVIPPGASSSMLRPG
jgi:hypothetical protein